MALKSINWEKTDEARLKKAVQRYNRILDNLKETTDTTPTKVDYKELKSGIFTRRGLNNTINSLNRLNKENATAVHTTESRN